MVNNQKTKTPMKEQYPNERNKNFSEVSFGYDASEAVNEANRCLSCKNKPCVAGCPVGVKIPEFIAELKKENYAGAYKIITETNNLPAICGRVCPQENQCEKFCVRAKNGESVSIGRLERFAADMCLRTDTTEKEIPAEKNGVKIAVVGSGPAGLTCAGDLAKLGYEVDIFESLHEAGGVLTYGIPEFRLPEMVVKSEIEKIKKLGVKINLNMQIGNIFTVDELFGKGYSAVFIGSGAGTPKFMGVEGEDLNGVYSANEFLTRINLMKAYKDDYATPINKSKTTIVIGGGNVAMDAARCAKRMGTENVYLVYRRGETELPARAEEVHHAKEEGVIFQMLSATQKINSDGNGFCESVEFTKMELTEPGSDGRRNVRPVEGSNFTIYADTVIMAIGTSPNKIIPQTSDGLKTNRSGCLVVVNDKGETTKKGVFAGGDAVSGAATVILAMGAGKTAAAAIHEYVQAK